MAAPVEIGVAVAVIGAVTAIVTKGLAVLANYINTRRKIDVADSESLVDVLTKERATLVREARELTERLVKLQEEVLALNRKALALERDCFECKRKHLEEVRNLNRQIAELQGGTQ